MSSLNVASGVRAKRKTKKKSSATKAVKSKSASSQKAVAQGKCISVRGAREHNLKNLHLEIPRDKLVVVTGLSGSGKSSLAFDTIYAEGQRRYVESLSAYARQFLNQNQKPDVDGIDGLSPAISIEQKSTSRNPRSTVGTLTEIYDYLRLLYARIGDVHCYSCGKAIQAQTVQDIVDHILELPEKTKFQVLAPIVRGRKGEYKKELEALRREGFVRVVIDGTLRQLDEDISLNKKLKHDIDVVVDRLVIKDGLKQRLTDSVELALGKAKGLVKIEVLKNSESTTRLYSERFACHDCDISYPEVEPRFFSFNSPHGACPSCDGLGHAMEFDPEKVIPDPSKSIVDGAVKPWAGRFGGYYASLLSSVCDSYDQSVHTPWKKLPKKFRDVVLYGSGRKELAFVYENKRGNRYEFEKAFEGVIPSLGRRFQETDSEGSREKLHQYMSMRPCVECDGARLRKESLGIKVGGKNISELTACSVGESAEFFKKTKFSKRQQSIARLILKEIQERLSFLLAVGLTYLSLDRRAGTLSGGEAQRIRLASQIGSGLQGVIYVLDEPSIGLHQRDNDRLLQTLLRLRDLGNTVLVVEHDEDTMAAADHIVDMGPGAGVLGGEIVAEGPPDVIKKHPDSLTGDYLSGRKKIEVPKERRVGNGKTVSILGAAGNNLQDVDVDIPLGRFVCVTGVSGSGKSTLVNETLYKALAQKINRSEAEPAKHRAVTGLEHLDKVIDIDQSPIGRTPRSNPATYTGLFTLIRDLFAGLPEAKARGYKPGRFSFNVKGGRCEACQGDGVIRIEMHFLPDVYVTCEQCAGRRYNRETLEVHYRGKSIADVLDMSIDEASTFLSAIPSVAKKLETLQAVGLGYVALGQSATTLSGGEAQRVKLSKELSKRATGRTMYILDEPTTGLHFHDVAKLLTVLHSLADTGNTVVVIEHNLDVIKTADHIIDLGPEGGTGGGQIVATGTPKDIVKVKQSHTGRFLKPLLK